MSTRRAGIVVLAAGASSRYGAAKLALPLDGVALIRRAALAATSVCRDVVVVTGAHAEPIAALIADLPVTISFNPDWECGIGDSIAHGVARLRTIAADADAVLIALADQYRIGAAQFANLLQMQAAGGGIVAASYAGRVGAPCVFPRECFDELNELHGPAGARELLRKHASALRTLPMAEAARDIDTPADYVIATARS